MFIFQKIKCLQALTNNILILIAVLMINSCRNFNGDKIQQHQSLLNDNQIFIAPMLEKEILSFVSYTDSVGKGNDDSILLVRFYRKGNNCYISFITSYFYFKKGFDGYLLKGKTMIAFYNTGNKCNKGIIEGDKLIKTVTKGYTNDEETSFEPYEPFAREYKIQNNNLELIYQGSHPPIATEWIIKEAPYYIK